MSYCPGCAERDAEIARLREALTKAENKTGPLLHKPNEPLPPGRCRAPKVMGMQMPCRDLKKAALKGDTKA